MRLAEKSTWLSMLLQAALLRITPASTRRSLASMFTYDLGFAQAEVGHGTLVGVGFGIIVVFFTAGEGEGRKGEEEQCNEIVFHKA